MVGCGPVEGGRSQTLGSVLSVSAVVKPATGSEADLVEQMATYRQQYYNALKSLEAYYEAKGNNMKYRWAKDELTRLERMPYYNYVIETVIGSQNLKPSESVSEADLLYREAYRTEKDARMLLVGKNTEKLRTALELYNQLIKKFPNSNKIVDAAWQAAGIYNYFKDYSIALAYYKKVYELEPNTSYSARYMAAQILDRHLERRDEALELYKQSLELEPLDIVQRRAIEFRIRELTKDIK